MCWHCHEWPFSANKVVPQEEVFPVLVPFLGNKDFFIFGRSGPYGEIRKTMAWLKKHRQLKQPIFFSERNFEL